MELVTTGARERGEVKTDAQGNDTMATTSRTMVEEEDEDTRTAGPLSQLSNKPQIAQNSHIVQAV